MTRAAPPGRDESENDPAAPAPLRSLYLPGFFLRTAEGVETDRPSWRRSSA